MTATKSVNEITENYKTTKNEDKFKEFHEDLLKVHKELKPIKKKIENTYFKASYADLNEIVEEVRPILAKHNFIFNHEVEVNLGINNYYEGSMDTKYHSCMICKIIHSSGLYLQSKMILYKSNDPQKEGSERTYAKRYTLLEPLGLTSENEDDDGNLASGNVTWDEYLNPAQFKVLLEIVGINPSEVRKTHPKLLDGFVATKGMSFFKEVYKAVNS